MESIRQGVRLIPYFASISAEIGFAVIQFILGSTSIISQSNEIVIKFGIFLLDVVAIVVVQFVDVLTYIGVFRLDTIV